MILEEYHHQWKQNSNTISGKAKMVGTASSLSRLVWPVRSKCWSSKCAEHKLETGDGVKFVLLRFRTQIFRRSSSVGNLKTMIQ